jgi:hypothetical protein
MAPKTGNAIRKETSEKGKLKLFMVEETDKRMAGAA